MNKKETYGIFGGSFDPIHIGHLNLAIEMIEKKVVDKIIFVPANVSPFKKNRPPLANAKHRIKMIELAILGLDFFYVNDLEIKRNGLSYTIDTLEELHKTYPNMRLIVEQEILSTFLKWKSYEKIIKLAPLAVGTNKPFKFSKKLLPFCKEDLTNAQILIRKLQISSTEIRDRLNKKLFCGHLLRGNVLDYILKHRLYL